MKFGDSTQGPEFSEENARKAFLDARDLFQEAKNISESKGEYLRKLLTNPAYVACLFQMRQIGLNPLIDPETNLVMFAIFSALQKKTPLQDNSEANRLLDDALGSGWKL